MVQQLVMVQQSAHGTVTTAGAEPYPPSWYIEDDDPVPQSRSHYLKGDHVVDLLLGWKARTGREVQVGKELALRWDKKHPRVGVDPDVYVVEPPPPEGDEVMSLRTWEPGHYPPLLAIEIVSPSRPDKDYSGAPRRYALSGVHELVVFDPKLFGPRAQGGPFRLQVWRRDDQGNFPRVYAGEGPVHSQVLDAWLHAVDEGRWLAIAEDQAGTRWWMTPEETERAAKETAQTDAEQARAAKEAARADAEKARADMEKARADAEKERTAKDEALRRLAELEALLAKQKG